jgi:AcrR family transcriptional regulator
LGLREQKKDQTRQLIADTAWRLFADRGFDSVSVAEIAREAGVSEATAFNYFRTKEDMFFFRLEASGSRLIDAVSARPAGEPVLAAVRRHMLATGGQLAAAAAGDGGALTRLRTVNRVIAASPALLARERQALAGTSEALAGLIVAEAGPAGDPVGAHVVANALVGVQHALIGHVRALVLGGADPAGIAADLDQVATRAFALLEHGFGDYARRPADGARPAGA